MKMLKNSFNALVHDESGQDLVEYALIAAMIALAAISGMNTVADKINNVFNTVGSKLE